MADNKKKNLNRSYPLSIAGVIVLTIGSILYLTVQDYLYFIDESKHEVVDQSQRITLLTDKYFDKYLHIFTTISKSDCMIRRDGAACSSFFARMNDSFPMVENFAAVDRNGRFFASGQPYDQENPPSVSELPFFRALKAGAASYVMNPHIGPISGERVTGMVIPLFSDTGAFDGLVGVSLKLKEIERLWEGTLDQQSANIFILDKEHTLIAASRNGDQLLSGGRITQENLAQAVVKHSGDEIAIGGGDYTLHMDLSQPSGWTILALTPARIAFSDYLKKRTNLEIAGAILTLLLGVSVIALIRDALIRARLKQTFEKLQARNHELQTLNALQQSEQRYHELFQNAPVALWEENASEALAHIENIRSRGVSDLNAYFDSHPEELKEIAAKVAITDVNKSSLALHQAESKEQLLGSLDRIFNENSYTVFRQELIALAEGMDYFETRGEVRTLNDETRTIIARVYRLGGAGDYGQILVATSDITQLTLTEEALRRSQKMDAIGQITGGIAHDFNNILGIIIGNLDLLRLQLSGEEKPVKRVDTALAAAMRAADLTRQLLGFSRQQVQENEPTDLNESLREMRNLITRSVTPAIEVVYRQAENLWPVSINPGDFKDALLNLVLNAKDAMPDGGKLTIQTVNRSLSGIQPGKGAGPYPGDYVALKISDTGYGIPADAIDHIFEPFYTTKPAGKGTGLGLSMVFGFVKRSNGDIRAESTPGKGTTICLLLPRIDAVTKKAEPVKTEDAAHLKVNETILVVDDEKDLLELALGHLEECGYKVIGAASGQEALQRLEENPGVDLLFTDIVMPGRVGGYELAEAAVRKNPQLKVLFTSGFNKQPEQAQSKFPGSLLLNKPYSPAELTHRLRQLLDS